MSPVVKPGFSEVRHVPLSAIHPASENDALYTPVDPESPALQALARSIGERGVLEPLIVSADGYIISGHRRYVAARVAGLRLVPTRQIAVSHTEDPQAFLQLLREYNRQRDKTIVEQVREELVTVSPTDAYASLIAHRQQAAQVGCATVSIEGAKVRRVISPAKEPMLLAIEHVLRVVLGDFLPVSLRKVHYELLNLLPLRHASKPESRYANTKDSYKDLSDLLTRARFAGRIPWAWISDETRPCEVWRTWPTLRPFVRGAVDGFLQGYWRNLQQTQPNHLEIICEKNTVHNIVRSVAMEYCIPVTSARGFSAVERYYHIMQRYRASGKERLILVLLTDFDPEGEEIVQVAGRTMRDDFDIANVDLIKAALTVDQARRYHLPPTLDAKETSANYARFIRKYGATTVYELEALGPLVQQEVLREAIDGVLDVALFNAELDREKTEAGWLHTMREHALATLASLTESLPPER